jgi:hypothetical protein
MFGCCANALQKRMIDVPILPRAIAQGSATNLRQMVLLFAVIQISPWPPALQDELKADC